MKKLIALLTVLCIALTMLTGCIGVKEKDAGQESVKDIETKEDIDKALDTLEDSGVSIDPDLEDLLDSIDQEDIDAAAAANSQIKVSADLPEGWTRDEDSPLPFNASNGFNMVMLTSGYMPSGAKDAKDVAEDAIEQIKEFFEDADYSSVESKKMAGYDGAFFYVDISITQSFVQRQEYFYFLKDGDVFMIQGAYMADDEAGAAEVHKVMDSLKIE